jgi:hypothetical protein
LRLEQEIERYYKGVAARYNTTLEISSIEKNMGVKMRLIFSEADMVVSGELEPGVLADLLKKINIGFEYRGDPGYSTYDPLGVIGFTDIVKKYIGHKNIQITTVNEAAGYLHEKWRGSRKNSYGDFKPQIEKTKDETWIEANGCDEIDIANTIYANLPADWQEENKASARVAINEIIRAIDQSSLNSTFIERASAIIHARWLERNGGYATPEQNKPYDELSENEKDKDRQIITKCIRIYHEAFGITVTLGNSGYNRRKL